ncbi:cytosolic phospholipase A2-like isoform X2 [Clavelina lepadiformis]
MYQAEVTPCLFLTVTVLRGRNISKGYLKDLVDTPDPYVKIYIKKAPNAHRQTRYINNDKNPEWNETFTFLLPNDLSGITAEFTLMDSNYTSDENMDSCKFELSELSIGETITKTFDFVETSQVDVEFQTELRCESDLRLEKHSAIKKMTFVKQESRRFFNPSVNYCKNTKKKLDHTLLMR